MMFVKGTRGFFFSFLYIFISDCIILMKGNKFMSDGKTSFAVFNIGGFMTFCIANGRQHDCTYFEPTKDLSVCKWQKSTPSLFCLECRCRPARDAAQDQYFAERDLERKLEDI